MAPSDAGGHLKVISWNSKGSRSHNKRMQNFENLKRLRANVALLQETYLAADNLSPL